MRTLTKSLIRLSLAATLAVGLFASPAAANVSAGCPHAYVDIPASGSVVNDPGGLMASGDAWTPNYTGSSNKNSILVAGIGTDGHIWAQAVFNPLGSTASANWYGVWTDMGGGSYYAPIVTGGVKQNGTTYTTITVKGTDGYRYSITDQNGTGWGAWTNLGAWSGSNPAPTYGGTAQWPDLYPQQTWVFIRGSGYAIQYRCG